MIGTIEQAIVDRITSFNGTGDGKLGYYIRSIESYGNELDLDINIMLRSLPAVWVVFMGGPIKEIVAGRYEAKPTFSVLVGQKNRRNEKASRFGAAGDVGTYQMIKDVLALVMDQDFGLAIEPMIPTTIRSVVQGRSKETGEDMSVYAIHFETKYWINTHADESGLDDFISFHADWDLPPHGNVQTDPLPAPEPGEEGAADTSTTTTLPQE
ncbi:MAG: phage protein Gp37 [Rhodospirillales bacterium]